MLENKVLDLTSDDVKEFCYKLLAFFGWYSRLDAQSFPDLLGAQDGVAVGFGEFALMGEGALGSVSFAGVLIWVRIVLAI